MECEGDTDTMVLAVTHFGTGTGIPTQPVVDFTFPLIDTGEIEEVEIGETNTQVEFKTIGTKSLLIGEFCAITTTATKAETESILCIGSKTKGKNCRDKYNDFLHNVVDFKNVIKKNC